VASSNPAIATSTPPPAGYALGYRPTWLPDGLVEQDRGVDARALHAYRYWGAPDEGRLPPVSTQRYLSLTVLAANDPAAVTAASQPVDINAITGALTTSDSRRIEVRWPVAADTVLLVRVGLAVPDSTNAALRFARSVVADTVTRFAPSLNLDGLPARIGDRTLASCRTYETEGSSPTDWQAIARFGYTDPGGSVSCASSVSVGIYRETLDGATQVTVRGRPAVAIAPRFTGKYDSQIGLLEVDVDGGLVLTVRLANSVAPDTTQPTIDDMVRIAEATVIGPTPDLTWLGTRP
jgi:hypothetical protein